MRSSRIKELGLAAILLGLVALGQQASAIHYHCQRARLYRCIPHYDYAEDHTRPAATAVAKADGVDDVFWLNQAAAAGQENRQNNPVKPVRRKKFHFPVGSLTVDQVTLDRVGLAIYDTGDVSCTGRITHDGGPDGDLRSNCVVLRLRAFAAPTPDSLLNAPVVWDSEPLRVRVRRDRPEVVPLAPTAQSPDVRRHFGAITHLEVELQYQRDR